MVIGRYCKPVPGEQRQSVCKGSYQLPTSQEDLDLQMNPPTEDDLRHMAADDRQKAQAEG